MKSSALSEVTAEHLTVLRDGVRMMALRALGDEDAADDAVQETLVRAMQMVSPEIAKDICRLGSYVGGIARNVIADVHRTRKQDRERGIPPYEHPPDALAAMIGEEEREAVKRAFAQLTPAEQAILQACVTQGMKTADLARELQLPAQRIRKRKSRAIEHLRALLRQQTAD